MALSQLVTLAAEPDPAQPDEKRYAVTAYGIVIGHVTDGEESMERRSAGKRYVNARWSRKCWRASPTSNHSDLSSADLAALRLHVGAWWRIAFRSRAEAAVALLDDASDRGGPLAAHRDQIVAAR